MGKFRAATLEALARGISQAGGQEISRSIGGTVSQSVRVKLSTHY